MNNAMADRNQVELVKLAKPFSSLGDSLGNIRRPTIRIAAINEGLSVLVLGSEPWSRADAIDLAFDEPAQGTSIFNAKHLELDAR